MKLSDFDFDLPDTLIAVRPAQPRSSARLLVAEGEEEVASTHFDQVVAVPEVQAALSKAIGVFIPAANQNRDGSAGITLHIETLYGVNNHHIAESCFKGVARALRAAVAIDARKADSVPSTKGTLGGV